MIGSKPQAGQLEFYRAGRIQAPRAKSSRT
jgi:hypothetical protein